MAAEQDWLIDPAEARLRAFRLIQDLQAEDPSAAAELADMTNAARSRGWSGLVRIGLYGKAVNSWITQAHSLGTDVEVLIEVARRDGDDCMAALGLALRAAFVTEAGGPASPAFDHDLAEAVVMLEDVAADALELISAHTACGIAFDYRSLWELGDEQYAAALRLAGQVEAGIGDTLLAAVMFNRAEAHVSWASRLYQIGDAEALAQRWKAWTDVAARSVTFSMPDAWDAELMTLGHLLAALSGLDVSAEVERVLAEMVAVDRRDPRATGHLKLAGALRVAGHSSEEATQQQSQAAADALQAVDPEAFPLLYDLALYLCAEVEAATGHPLGLLCAQHQIKRRWADRVTQLSAMESRIASRRMRREFDLVSLQVTRDDLTGIGNRRALVAFTTDLERRGVDQIGLIMVDIDRFKEVNDRHGHNAGDAVLTRIAVLLDDSVRPVDLAVRLGGDEFMVVLADVDVDVASERAANLIDQIDEQSWSDVNPELQVTVSMGVAAGRRVDLDSVRAGADRAVYESKRAGGHKVTRRGSS
jgi:diguanylate cyclase (GGDEF)-like protein